MMEFTFSMKASHFLLILYLSWMKYISSAATCSGLRQLENGKTFFRYGGMYANFACNPGFSLLGHVSSSCIRGRWRKPLPVCIASGCHMPTSIVYGSLKTSHNNAVITVTCKKGYKLVGSSLIFCDGKTWNSTIPMCKEIDMMSSSLQKKNSDTEMSFVGNSFSKKDPIRVLFNATQKRNDNSEMVSFTKAVAAPIKQKDLKNIMSSYHGQDLLKVGEHQRQLQSPKTFLSFRDGNNVTRPRLKGLKVVKTTSTPENIDRSNLRNYVTSWYSWFSATQMQNSKNPQKINQTSQVKATLNVTEWYNSTPPGLLDFMNPQTKHPHFVKHKNNVATSSYNVPTLHIRTTTAKVPQTTQQVQSKYSSSIIESRTPTNSIANKHLPNLLALALETVSKTIPPSTQRYSTTQIITKKTNFSNTTTPAQMLTNITSSFINYNHTLPDQLQTTHTPIVGVKIANVEDVNTTDQDNLTSGYNITFTDLEYKVTVIQSPNLYKPSNLKVYSTPETTSIVTTITGVSKRTHKNFGMLKKAFKRRVQCVYPPVPSHGTFRFLTIRDPPPNQYPFYIEYSCYPGYTMSTGDVQSFCKDNGEWSGITPVCED